MTQELKIIHPSARSNINTVTMMLNTPSVFAKSFLRVPKQTIIICYQLLLLSLLLFLLSVPENLELILFTIYRVLISRMTGNYSQFGLEPKICVKFAKMQYGLFNVLTFVAVI